VRTLQAQVCGDRGGALHNGSLLVYRLDELR